MNVVRYYYYYLDSLFAEYSLIIQITVTLVTVLTILFLFSLYRLLYLNRSINRKKRRKEDIKSKYRSQLLDILYQPEYLEMYKIKEMLNAKDKYKNWEHLQISRLLIEIISEDKEQNNQELSSNFNVRNYINTINPTW